MSIKTKLHPIGGGNGKKVEISQIACSATTTWYITVDGDLYGCGNNTYGQQGSGDTTDVLTFTKRASNVAKVFCTSATTWYIDTSGDLYGCGNNANGQQGISPYIDPGTKITTFTKRASNVIDVVCSEGVTWYIDTSNKLYGCGRNTYGQQGSGTTTDIAGFTQRATSVAKVACSEETTWYINSTGKLYGCGRNNYGQQGSGNTTDVKTFTQRTISGVTRLEKVFCNTYVTWVISSTGSKLYGCGRNSSYNQGESSSTSNITSFTQRASDVAQVFCNSYSAQYFITWYLTNSGNLYACGNNTYGQQGNGGTTSVSSFTARASNVAQITASGSTTWYINTSGDLYGCGRNNYGQQGNGTSGTEEKVTTFTKRASNVAKTCNGNGDITWYLTTSGDMYGCGRNAYGQQGNGNTIDVTTFTKRH